MESNDNELLRLNSMTMRRMIEIKGEMVRAIYPYIEELATAIQLTLIIISIQRT